MRAYVQVTPLFMTLKLSSQSCCYITTITTIMWQVPKPGGRGTVVLAADQQWRSADSTSWPADTNPTLFINAEGMGGGVSWRRFHATRSWHMPAGAGTACNHAVQPWRKAGVFLGWSARVPRERLEIILTGWVQFLLILAFPVERVILGGDEPLYKTAQEGVDDTSDTVWNPAAGEERC